MNLGTTLRCDFELRESLGSQLFPDAVIVQEDCNLIMGCQQPLDLDGAHDLQAAYLGALAHQPLPVGHYRLLGPSRENEWKTYQAVVHDLDARPSCRPDQVSRLFLAIMADALGRNLEYLASEPLGAWRNSGLTLPAMAGAFADAVVELATEIRKPLRLALLLPGPGQLEAVSRLVRCCVLERASGRFAPVASDSGPDSIITRTLTLTWR